MRTMFLSFSFFSVAGLPQSLDTWRSSTCQTTTLPGIISHLHNLLLKLVPKSYERKLFSQIFLFRYGIKKLSGVHRRTKALKKLDMSRCQLSQNGFYELIPIILKSEHVILQVKTPFFQFSELFLTHPGQPDHPIGAEDIFRPAEVKLVLGNHQYHFLHWFDMCKESAIITQICLAGPTRKSNIIPINLLECKNP